MTELSLKQALAPDASGNKLQQGTVDDLAAQLAGTRIIHQPAVPAFPTGLQTLDVEAVPSQAQTPAQPATEASNMQDLLADLSQALDTNQISDVLHTVIRHIDAHPETADLLRPDEIGLIVQACQQSFTVTVTTKQQRQKKTSEKKQRQNRFSAALGGLGF